MVKSYHSGAGHDTRPRLRYPDGGANHPRSKTMTAAQDHVQLQNLPTEGRDVVLGHFMGVWSELEGVLFLLFWVLLGTSFEVARLIHATGFEVGRTRETLIGLGRLRLNNTEQKTLEGLCERLGGQSKWRNRLVHGSWTQLVTIKDGNIKGSVDITQEWMRVYQPVDPNVLSKMMDINDQKTKSNYTFTLTKISSISKNVSELVADITTFYTAICQRLYPDGLPQ